MPGNSLTAWQLTNRRIDASLSSRSRPYITPLSIGRHGAAGFKASRALLNRAYLELAQLCISRTLATSLINLPASPP
jgi:hypothetical protein